MKHRPRRANGIATALFACTAIGFGLGWTLRGHAPEPVRGAAPEAAIDLPVSSDGTTVDAKASAARMSSAKETPVPTSGEASALDELHRHELRLPIEGANVASFKGQFADRRDAGHRPHQAVDILAPRNTPVHAVEDGTIAKLFFSKGGGGITIYQYDPTDRFCYYYAHLERYADGLHDGQRVARGDVIGFVGTTGNAPANTPHLHFAVFELGPDRRWWKGEPIDPYLAFTH